MLRQLAGNPSRVAKYSLILVSRAVAATGMLLLNIVVARLIGVEALGQLTVAIALLIGSSIVTRCGYDQSLLRFAGTAYGQGDHASVNRYLKSAVTASLCIGLINGGLLFYLSPYLAKIFAVDGVIIHAVAIALIPFSISSVLAGAFRATDSQALAQFFEVGGYSLLVALSLLFLSLFFAIDIAEMCLTLAVVPLVVMGIGGSLFLVRMREVSRKGAAVVDGMHVPGSWPVWRSSLILALVALAQFSVQWAGALFTASMMSTYDAAMLGAAQRISMVVFFILNLVGGIIAPRLALLYAQGKLSELVEMDRKTTRYMTYAVLPLIAVIVTVPHQIMRIFGAGFDEAGNVLVILALGQFVNVATGCTAQILGMTGRERVLLLTTILGGLLNIFLALLLTPMLGAVGAAAAAAAALVSQQVMARGYIKRSWLALAGVFGFDENFIEKAND